MIFIYRVIGRQYLLTHNKGYATFIVVSNNFEPLTVRIKMLKNFVYDILVRGINDFNY